MNMENDPAARTPRAVKRRVIQILMILAACLLVIGAILFWMYVVPLQSFFNHRDRIEEMVASLEDQPPPGVGQREWENLCEICGIGVANAIFYPTWVPLDEVIKLEEDLKSKLENEPQPDEETLIWFWERMGQCSPKAKEYITRMRPLLDDAVYYVRKSRKSHKNQH